MASVYSIAVDEGALINETCVVEMNYTERSNWQNREEGKAANA